MTPSSDLSDFVDLHVHTTASDGTLTPSEVVALARARKLRAIAITDHDTNGGNVEALTAGAGSGVEVLSGVEISTQWEGMTFHLLGYGVRPDGPRVRETFDFLEDCRRQRNPRMIERLQNLGLPITLQDVEQEAGGSLVGRPHFARVLLKRGAVASIQDAFDRFLGRGAAAYVDKTRLSPPDACSIIAEAGGVPVLAHPGLVERDHPGRLVGLVHHLISLGLEGIEAHYSGHTPEQTASYLGLARQLRLLPTGGSDFHQLGEDAGPQLGSGFGSLRVPYACYTDLRDRILTRSPIAGGR
jgi:predicted metal-dependent phosphoesterase TrpH